VLGKAFLSIEFIFISWFRPRIPASRDRHFVHRRTSLSRENKAPHWHPSHRVPGTGRSLRKVHPNLGGKVRDTIRHRIAHESELDRTPPLELNITESMPSEEEIFEAAAALPAAARGAHLDRACVDSPGLRVRIEALLKSHDLGGFMEAFAAGPETQLHATEWNHLHPEQCGQQIGRYKLLEQIGEGGFGAVWVAEQCEPVRRRVALKIIKPGMDSREIIARFEQERQALAMMEHPGIAKIFDAGVTDRGRPYFVMELVRGSKITEFCDQARLATKERLQLFSMVCQAAQHAHQKGIIHRDLKPSNILVTAGDDGSPLPQIIDFGVAKAVQQSLTSNAICTRNEQTIGTPAYMSPEQAGLGPMDIDTRSDVYSLGVLLYELLTGKPPFDPNQLASVGHEEMRRIICEVEPQRPSTRLSQLNRGDLTALAADHQAHAPQFLAALRGDLDWIVMKAIDKDRSRRYASANGLAADIQRFLADEPVVAGPPSKIYRLRKFMRRHRRTVIAALLVSTTLIAGIIGTGLGLVRARSERDLAQRHLYESLIGQSRSTLVARMNGYRPQVLSLLGKANRLRPADKDPDEIRQLAIDSLGDFVGLPPVSIDALPGRVTAVAFHPRLPLLAVGLRTGSIQLRDIESGRSPMTLEGHRATISGLAFNEDGKLTSVDLVGEMLEWSSSEDGSWKSTRLENIEDSGSLADIAVSARRMATVHPQGVALWDLRGSKIITRLSGLGGPAALNPTGELLAAGEPNGITVYGIDSGKTLYSAANTYGLVMSAAFNADSSLMACGCDEGLIVLEVPSFQAWRSSGGAADETLIVPEPPSFQTRMTARSDSQTSVAFHPSRPLLASGSISGQVRVWNVATNRETALLDFADGGGSVSQLHFHRDGKYLAAANHTRVRLWNISGTEECALLAGHSGGVTAAEFSPDGSLLATCGKDRTVTIWDRATGQSVQVLRDFSAYVQTIAFHPSGRLLATGDYAGRVLIWDWESGRIVANGLRSAEGFARPVGRDVYKVGFSPDGRLLAASGGGIHIWRLPDDPGHLRDAGDIPLETVASLGGRRSLTFCFSTDSSLLAWINNDTSVCLYDVLAGKSLPFSGPYALHGWHNLAFLPRSRSVTYVSDRQQLQVWDADSDRSTFTMGEEGEFRGYHISVSPDGRWLLGEVDGNTPAVWNFVTRKRLMLLPRTHSPVWTTAWSRDSNHFAVGLSDGGASIWSLPQIRRVLGTLDLDWTTKELSSRPTTSGERKEQQASSTPRPLAMPLGSEAEADAGRIRVLQADLTLRGQEEGPKHPESLRAMARLATALRGAGRRDEALRLHEELLPLSSAVNGPKHRDTLRAMQGLANSYFDAGRWSESVNLAEQLLELSREVCGKESTETLVCMNNLAPAYALVNRLSDALAMGEEVWQVRRRVAGPAHPDTLDSLNNLTTIYRDLGRNAEALRLGEELLELRLQANGPQHADTAKAKFNLAETYRIIGRLADALKQGEEAFAMFRRINGSEHPDTLLAMNILSDCYAAAGRGDEAIKLLEDRLAISRRVTGLKHADTLTAMDSLASGRAGITGDHDQALRLREEVLKLRKETEGEDHPSTLAAMSNLSISYRLAGRLEAATSLQEDALKRKRSILRPDHPWTIVALNNLADCYDMLKRPDEAKTLRAEASQLERGFPALATKPPETGPADDPGKSAPPPEPAITPETDLAASSVLIPENAEWRWLHPVDGRDPEITFPGFHQQFTRLDFDDSQWRAGEDNGGPAGGFGYGLNFAGVGIGKPEMKDRHTAYFRHRFTTTKPHTGLTLRCHRDDGIIVYLDGKEILRDNMEPGEDAYLLHAERAMDREDEGVVHRFAMTVDLKPGPHVLAISVHNCARPNSDLRLGSISLVETEAPDATR
jgi:WD40 repeat protein/serine/threonine protein kinase/tetratricopeptide (TPR) repeat protein